MCKIRHDARGSLSPDQLRNARLMLKLSQSQLGALIGHGQQAISAHESHRGACTKSVELAIRFLLVEAGIYSHFRMLYLNKKKLDIEPENLSRNRRQKNRLVVDALAFKYNK